MSTSAGRGMLSFVQSPQVRSRFIPDEQASDPRWQA
jgi:hypothetical protein